MWAVGMERDYQVRLVRYSAANMNDPLRKRALRMLRELRRSLPDLQPESRSMNAECRRFREAASLCVEGRHGEAIATMTAADAPADPPAHTCQIIRFP